jgi:electron transport complex protein RnfC
MKRLGGVHAPHRKNTAAQKPELLPTPSEIILPMSMHIGAPAKPVVKVGDEVKVGQLIAEAGGFVSSPVYTGVSGKVKAIDSFTALTGQRTTAVTIAADGLQTMFEGLAPPQVTNLEEFLTAVRDSGVVGLGGAGFPTAVKLTVKDLNQIDHIIINGAECEPYITSDTRTLLDEADAIKGGIGLLKEYMKTKKIVVAVEKNKPEAISKMRETLAGMDGVEVAVLPSVYPQGGEKVLIYSITGRRVPEGKLPLDVGVVVLNVTTLAAIHKYVATGMPLVSKCLTVDGSAVKTPKNVIAPVGTPIRDVFDFCGGLEGAEKILFGGPMMGIAAHDVSAPVLKNTNALLAFDKKDAVIPEPVSCIRCGRCVEHCPLHLMPLNIETAYSLKKPELLEKYKVNVCMECGCCAYICPAKRPLVQVMKLSKLMLREYQDKKKAEAEKEKAKREQKEKEKGEASAQ